MDRLDAMAGVNVLVRGLLQQTKRHFARSLWSTVFATLGSLSGPKSGMLSVCLHAARRL